MLETHHKPPFKTGPFSTEPYLLVRDHMVSGETFELRADNQEELLKTEPVPTDLAPYYKSNAYYSHHDDSGSPMARIYRLARKWNTQWKLRLLNRWSDGCGKLLEIGSGTGNFLKAADHAGWTVTGVEPDSGARQAAERKGISLYPSLDLAPKEQVDIIALWHVLEHIPDLERTLMELSARLKPGGILIVALPNFRSLDARYYKSNWAGYDVPRHLWHFSRSGIRKLLAPFGFEEQQQKAMRLDAFYVSWLSEKYRKNPLGPLAAFAIGFWSNLSAGFNGEYSSVAYVYRKEANGQ